ncbi:DNA recombination protein RmuC [Dokdonia sp. Hel_I_53]|uniref:DNA recombination protein RmuC n=1 Tax=Dokdonia sp. Hel_I_53 TaxID=1566287 RepID=UPI001199A125|nr:DNA recombination protein RmuC [Dokdonia sp. Hel_I_53]TVZ51022.1 DNA recombination protein RmuC [Dokdonia sp. Hel_I_53]
MNESLLLLLIATGALLIGAALGFFIANLKKKGELSSIEERLSQAQLNVTESKDAFAKAENQISEIRAEKDLQLTALRAANEKQLAYLREEKDQFQNELTARNVDFSNLKLRMEEKNMELQQLQEKFTKDFEIVAQKILEDKSSKFTLQNKQNLDIILKPLQEKIQHFEKRVEETNKEAIDRTSALREQIKGLTALNEQMTKEASNLTKALKGDSKMQGNWGELVLERVLEKSGLEKDREYFMQQSFTTEEGNRVLPDVVIHLPDNKKMIVDSKVSLRAYERFVNEDDKILRDAHLKEHINALKRHVQQLSDKNYHDLYQIESPDFVLLFIPIEPAFAIAINSDNQLYNQAFEKNIVIVTPSTLLATLRTIDSMWNNEKQQQNALEIAKQAGALYDKFHGLVTDLTSVGKKMDDAKQGYSAAMNKLVEGNGNLITRVERLKKMGAKAKKALPDAIIKRALGDDDTLTLKD